MEGVAIRVVVGLLRHGLQVVSGWLISRGIATEGDIETLMTGLALAVVTFASFLWSEWRKRRARDQR